jgi:DNA helicase-2/ATP-dependent DNA helicase PcrA
MTVHSAKGLEFNAVFITGLEEGLFPHENSAKEDGGLEEERRLMYVAITRARQRLYLSFSQTRMLHGQTRYGMRSRFFDELPDAALKWLSPRVQHHWFANPKSWEKSAWDDGAPEAGANRIAQSFGRKDLGWRVGQNVKHAKFGEGVIFKLEGDGDNVHAQINFGRSGTKKLDLSVAKLEKLN